MGLYTDITRGWLEARFARTNADGSYFAHMPIYGAGAPGAEGGHLGRLLRMFAMLRILDGIGFSTLLDVGGAEGWLAHLVRTAFGAQVASCDLSVEACRRARELFGLPSAAVDTAWLPFGDDAFDVVVCSEVIEHVEQPVALVLELLRVARHAVVVTTEELKHDRAFVDDWLFKRPGWPHMERNLFGPEDVATLLPDARTTAQADVVPPLDVDGPESARRWLRAHAGPWPLQPGHVGVIAVRGVAAAAPPARARRYPDTALIDLVLDATVAPGARHADADAPLPAWFTSRLRAPRPDRELADYPTVGAVPDLVDPRDDELPRREVARRAAAVGVHDRDGVAALLALHDRLYLPPRATLDAFDFRRVEHRRGFWPNAQLAPRPGGAAFSFWSTGGDPWILTPCLDRAVGAIELDLRVHNPDLPVPAGTGQVFWRGPGDVTVGEDRCVSFQVPNDGAVHTHRVELQGHPRWPDRVHWLRLDLVDGPCEVDLLALRLYPPAAGGPAAG